MKAAPGCLTPRADEDAVGRLGRNAVVVSIEAGPDTRLFGFAILALSGGDRQIVDEGSKAASETCSQLGTVAAA